MQGRSEVERERERDGRETKGGDGLDSGLKLSIS